MSFEQLSKPYTLPSGLVLPNRLANAAMTEQMAGPETDYQPNEALNRAYATWAEGGWGLVLTGNVQVDSKYLGGPKDTALIDDEAKMLEAWKAWAKACKGASNGNPTVVQINHPGRQSPFGAGTRGFFEKNLAPSAIPLDLGAGILAKLASAVVFGTPKEMTVADIQDVVARFARTARISAEAGFDGIEIHAAHGYLLAQFLSAKSNTRTDAYGGSPAKRAQIIVEIIKAVRAATPEGFTVGIKQNSVDHQSESDLNECIEQLQAITDAGIDFLEVSGGSYEDPSMFLGTEDSKKSDRTKAREAFFIEFAKAIRSRFPQVPLIVTGGFRTRLGMEAALEQAGCDIVGIGRPAVLNPHLPKNTIFNKEVKDEDAKLYARKIEPSWLGKLAPPAIGAGAESSWYSSQMAYMTDAKA
ncbi:hypothetical protein VPNG_03444 [Cytospora leucostoma]|uniref:NADH:flavin oxidoreductase/NADH oxidase N-terminal domain-containing protein n=1 Tax=Cytospora leucostoma TaxID=1230097 RepID=A0A423XFL9_9PEZI|nr:hypothetical protein VPNG_03444 [Cytospora leucostoma]